MNKSRISQNLRAGKLALLLSFAGLAAQAQNPQLLLGLPSANAQTLSLTASLSNPGTLAQISGLQFSFTYSTAEFNSVTVAATSGSIKAGKTAYCSAADGTAICILAGLNLNQIGSGPVATCVFVKSHGFRNASSVQLTSALRVTADGTGIALGVITKIGQGNLTGSVEGPLVSSNLTQEGAADWIHWGDSVRKAAVTLKISALGTLGNGVRLPYSLDTRSLSWADGDSVLTNAGSRDGIFIYGSGSGFEFSVPADLSTRTLIVHVSGFYSSGKLTAQLPDHSAPDFTDYSQYSNGFYDRDYKLHYNAASSGQMLKVTWVTASGGGGVGISAAALF